MVGKKTKKKQGDRECFCKAFIEEEKKDRTT